MKRLIIIDTFGFFFRSYFALPPLKSPNNFPVGLLMGFANFIIQLHKEHRSDYVIFALDSKEEGIRKKIDANYKAQRPLAPDDLLKQIPVAIEWIEKMGFKSISVAGYEADDVIASINRLASAKELSVRIISHDKDLYQLINENTHLFDPLKKKEIKAAQCLEKYGVSPEQFIDYQSIVGDSADNVPGVRGIGAKGAQKLITQFGSLDTIYEHLERVDSLRIRELLEIGREDAYRSRELVRLRENLIADLELESCRFPALNPLLSISDELLDFGLKRVLEKLKKEDGYLSATAAPKKAPIPAKDTSFIRNVELVSKRERLEELLANITPQSVVAFDTETDSLDTRCAKLVGFSFCLEGKVGYYVPIAHNYLGVDEQLGIEDAKWAIKRIFGAYVIGHNLKFDFEILHQNLGILPTNSFGDSMILAWLIDSSSPVGLDFQMKRWFSHEMIAFDEMVRKGETFAQVNLQEAAKYAGEDALATYLLYFKLIEELKKRDCEHLLELAKELEFPFIHVLVSMEERGIKVDTEFFGALFKEVNQRIGDLSSEIYAHAGGEFNLNSPQQLGIVLFETLALPSSKKTRTGYSTNETVLNSLLGAHPIIEPLLEYRELFKLKSTYIEPLMRLASTQEDHRVYTSFLQTGTSTGRLSSKNPNLQNIPVKTEVGRQIRQGFIASEGNLLISLDYSQIELRLLAHFSQDPALVAAFKEGADIHFETARRIFGKERAQEHRGIAKSINFGLIYGMGARKLSETLKITPKEAKGYIDSYFASFPTVKSFLKSKEDYALLHGYAQTLLGRRRYFDFEGAAEYQKAAYLREAVNSIFQGSAADLIKLAMAEIRERFSHEESLWLLLQVHDELIFEAPRALAEDYAKNLAKVMEGIYPLDVPLKCGIALGEHWGALK
ncbi:MAG: DNA polymerase I [Wolinella sp.]